MTQQTAIPDIQSWWNEISFPGKEGFDLKETGELLLLGSKHCKERSITTFTPDNAVTIFNATQEKFAELTAKIKELEAEWVAAEDKLKLAGKVERFKEYLLHVSATGDFDKLFELLHSWEKTIGELTEEHYNARLKLVEEAESIVENNNFKETTQAYKDITEKWKQAGYIDKAVSDRLWNRLDNAKNKFFERKRQNQESHDQEMMQNLDLKMELVEKAEALAQSEEWKATTETYKKLMEQWKTVGHTHNDKNELLWNKFIAARNTFFDRKKVHAKTIQQEQDANYGVKLSLVERAEQIKDSTDWNATTNVFEGIMDEWKKSGRVNAEKGDELWARLNAAKEVFFNAKRAHFSTMRMSMEDNLAQKTAIIKRAESLKHSSNWSDATAEMNELMDDWKKIGPVGREQNNKTWEQFLAARKFFFARKDAYKDERKERFEKQKGQREEQSRNFLNTLVNEIKEEEELLADFREGLKNVTPGRKEHELRAHLENLIREGEVRITRKQEKLASIKNELPAAAQKPAKVKPAARHKESDTTTTKEEPVEEPRIEMQEQTEDVAQASEEEDQQTLSSLAPIPDHPEE